MASRRTLNLLFTLHSWAGLVTGLLLFIVCFSGAVVVFKNEIDRWANPSLGRLPTVAQPVSLDTVLASVQQRHPQAEVETLQLPDALNPAYLVFARLQPADAASRTKLAVRADTGELLGPVDSQLGQFLRSLHVFLFFGPRWIVGFLGVAMLVLIATGIVIHRKILAELFTQRWGRSLRVVMSDLHKSAGIWGLAFHLLIAFTGAWLGLAPVFERAAEYLTAPSAAVPKKPAKAALQASAPPPATLQPLLLSAQQAVPGLLPRFASLQRWGRPGATVRFTGAIDGSLYSTALVQIDVASGRVIQVLDPRRGGFWTRFNGLMEPLHFGDFGGLGLKTLYFLLGMTPAFLSLTGTLIWLDGRRQRRAGRADAPALAATAP